MSDIMAIYDHLKVKTRGPGKGRKDCEKVRRKPGEGSQAFKCRLFREHEWLYNLGSRVLLEELVAGTGGLGPVSLESIHETFDPILTDPSSAVRCVGVPPASLASDAPLFVEAEVEPALNCLQATSAPGPDG